MEFTKKGDVKWQMQRNMQKTTKDSKRRIGQLVVRGRPKGSSPQTGIWDGHPKIPNRPNIFRAIANLSCRKIRAFY